MADIKKIKIGSTSYNVKDQTARNTLDNGIISTGRYFNPDVFTVVGNPKITDDGIASGFSSSNYITKNLDIDLSKNVIIKARIIIGSLNEYPINYGNAWQNGIHFEIQTTGLAIVNISDSNGTPRQLKSSVTYSTGDIVDFKLRCVNNGLSYECDFYKNGVFDHTDILTNPLETPIIPATKEFILGKLITTSSTGVFTGSIDLKQLSITVNGNKVLDGSKYLIQDGNLDIEKVNEKMHALKCYPDKGELLTDRQGLEAVREYNRSTFDLSKFTVAGSPTITNDGIASGFYAGSGETTSCIDTIKFLPGTSSWEVKGRVIYKPIVTGSNYIIYNSAGDKGVILVLGGITVSLYVQFEGGTVSYAEARNTSSTFAENDIIDFILSYNSTTQTYSISVNKNGEFWGTGSFTSTAILRQTDTGYVRLGARAGNAGYLRSSIDLKQFSMSIDGVEVFNGNKTGTDVIDDNISIPYNQTITGLKIVQSTYRSRVQSMYNKYGWANYFTLSDTDFTLPMGENLDGHVTKVDWYKNGITTWEYDTNLDCIETGSCTSGTAVTLPKPMADDTYTLSVPYSAKSKTGFTPTATGDYIAKGKITLG